MKDILKENFFMKKFLTLTITIFLLFSLAFPGTPTPLKAKVTLKESKIVNVSVDPRIELLSAVQLLSDYPLLTQSDFQYKREMINYFSPFKSHPAVTKFIEMSKRDFNYEAPPTAMLFLSNPPELKIVTSFTDYIIGRAGGKENLESFIEALRDFAIKSNFMDFFNAHKDFYALLIKDTETKLGNYKDVAVLESFYGISKNSYNIILTPISADGYGPRIEIEPSKFDIYAIIGAGYIKDNKPIYSPEPLRRLVWHEFSHSFVNPITEKYRNEVNKYSKLFLPIKDIMERYAYGEWETCVNEHIIRAVVAKFNEKVIGQDADGVIGQVVGQLVAEKMLSYEVEIGFVYIRGIYELLNVYENNRDKYPTFEDFYPEILNYFSEISKSPSLPMDLDFNFLPTEFTEKKVELTWRDTSDDEEGFKIYKKSDNEEEFKLIATLKENTKSFEDTTIEFGKTYIYRVSSFNENGENFAPEDVTVDMHDSIPPIIYCSCNLLSEVFEKTLYISGYAIDNGISGIKDSSIYINGKKIRLSEDSSFNETITLNKGMNKISIEVEDNAGNKTKKEYYIKYTKRIVFTLQIGNKTMYVNYAPQELDVPPQIIEGRTYLPIRWIAEPLGAQVGWDPNEKKVTVILGSTTIELWINKPQAKVNGVNTPIDSTNPKVVPEIINSRTMLPLSFVTESLGCDVQWDETTKTITITYPKS